MGKPFIRGGRLTKEAQAELASMDINKLPSGQQAKALDALRSHNAGKALTVPQTEALFEARHALIRKG